MESLTAWDWLLGGLVIVSVGLGLLAGLVRTAFALASWVVALVGALLGSPLLIASFHLNAPVWALALPLFLVIFVLTRLIGSMIAKGLAAVGLGGIDRMLGGVVGAARALIALVAATTGFDRHPEWVNARSRPLLDEISSRLAPLLPVKAVGTKRI
jgi:membrane protein required for colicin V production